MSKLIGLGAFPDQARKPWPSGALHPPGVIRGCFGADAPPTGLPPGYAPPFPPGKIPVMPADPFVQVDSPAGPLRTVKESARIYMGGALISWQVQQPTTRTASGGELARASFFLGSPAPGDVGDGYRWMHDRISKGYGIAVDPPVGWKPELPLLQWGYGLELQLIATKSAAEAAAWAGPSGRGFVVIDPQGGWEAGGGGAAKLPWLLIGAVGIGGFFLTMHLSKKKSYAPNMAYISEEEADRRFAAGRSLRRPGRKMLSKAEAAKQFIDEVIPGLDYDDPTAIRTAWNDYTDYLCKSGLITERSYETWTTPMQLAPWLRGKRRRRR